MGPSKNRFPHQKVLQDEPPFAGNEWSTANTACNYPLWPRFRFDDLVQRMQLGAAEKRTRGSEACEHGGPNLNFLSLIFLSLIFLLMGEEVEHMHRRPPTHQQSIVGLGFGRRWRRLQEFQQLGNVGRDPPRLVTCKGTTFTAASRASFGGIKC